MRFVRLLSASKRVLIEINCVCVVFFTLVLGIVVLTSSTTSL